MSENSGKNNSFEGMIVWEVPEYQRHDRGKRWYIIAGVVAVALIIYSLITGNFLFALIIIMGGIITIVNDGKNPMRVTVAISGEGIFVGKKFYDYDEIKNFSIVYRPKEGIKNLYFEFNNALKHRISIPLDDINPLILRDSLLQYLDEDLERTYEPVSETLAKLFRL